MNPILTIAFPTFNKGFVLKETLDQLLPQIENKNIEILISDNSSTDSTFEIGSIYSKNYKNVRYYRNSMNLEFDGNCIEIFKRANGEYLWMIGDDYILPNTIESILKCIEESPLIIHLNYSYITESQSLKMDNPRYAGTAYSIYEDKNIFLTKMGINGTFVSSLVFNMRFLRKIENLEKFNGTYFLYYHVALTIMNNPGIFIINNHLSVAGLGNKSVRYDYFKLWIKNYGDVLLKTGLEQNFSKQILMEILHYDLINHIYGFIIYYRLNMKNSKKLDTESIWEYINLFPDLKRLYKKAVYMPLWFISLELKLKRFFKVNERNSNN